MANTNHQLKHLDDALSNEDGLPPHFKRLADLREKGGLEELHLAHVYIDMESGCPKLTYVARAKDKDTYDNLYNYLIDEGIFTRKEAFAQGCAIEHENEDMEYKKVTFSAGRFQDKPPVIDLLVFNPKYKGDIRILDWSVDSPDLDSLKKYEDWKTNNLKND